MANILSRQKRLVKYLAVAKQPLTAKELAGTLEVSTKTVRNDIQQINLSLDSNKIVSKNGIGFYFKKQLDNDTQLQMENDSPNALYDLLLQLLDHKSCNFYDLADLFFISESTLNRYIKDLNYMLLKDNSSSLPIQRKNNQIFIQGKEEDKRKIFNRFLNQEVEENKLDLEAYSDYFEKSNLKQLSKLIVSFHRKEEIEMNDFSTITFILHIAVLIERVRKGSYLNIQLSTMIDKKSSYLTTKLVEILEKTFSIELPKEEFAYIYRMYAGSVLANENLSNEYLKKAVEQMFENIYTTFYS
ncbi:putative DeoR family transcriptional regulator [Tetragenococcus halophilus subsp. halophilus]|uniref:DeoR family transcriptional regulator n=6 Tax=Tetragenococcus halophilus TaxID=51669 RepID=A0AAN1SF53_TETHN|nr:HTH domain-containing protein [Tetragenococcus halophilus]NWO01108.1 HTH domain-containing protein [Tetragenococcus halophilus]BAK93864.1 putative DeoR family transcriptional regulator [Tetragenococcus halophilus NBRC 12172]GBD62456.1 putative DeoR family transcriptional regulator [Tetragenococcus halophilus subsp. halophilus]GBD70549.1 putative DeoR family transcriptional regulator [Tetragenococcus halophilus subsp. halophilus]GBD80611.1 putative DeoR family transcriptional regulator [Tetr